MASLWAFILAFQACWVFCQSGFCQRPANIDGSTGRINQICPNGICPQFADGQTCHCKVEFRDQETEPEPSSQETSNVKAFMLKKMCWNDDESGYYEDCDVTESPACKFEDKIEICYEDDIDAAQALCRHFGKGDAFGAAASASRRMLRSYESSSRRIRLAKLKCPVLPRNLNDCTLEWLPRNSQCSQMVAKCRFTACWQARHIIRASVQGKVRYGQACKLSADGSEGICGQHCFRCPSSWGGDPRDGVNCFRVSGDNARGELTWE